MAYDANERKGTGRTTRMLEEALRLSSEGRAVYVVADNRAHAKTIEAQLAALSPPEHHGIKVEDGNRFPELDWVTMTMPRAHPNCAVLVDHYAVERRIVLMLQMMHRFDA